MSCLPPFEKSLVRDNQWQRCGYFCETQKTAVARSQWKSNYLKLQGLMSCCEVTIECMRSEVNYGAFVTFNSILISDLISHPLTSCIIYLLWLLNVTTGPKWTSDLIHTHCDTTWHHTLKLILSNFDFHWLRANAFLLVSQKNSYSILIDCHAPVIFQVVEDKTMINLITEPNLPNTSYFLIQNRFSNCSLYYGTPCILIYFSAGKKDKKN